MARPLELETFDLPEPGARDAGFPDAALADLKLAAYEQGYGAGWGDAVQAQSADIARLRGELGRNLADMALSHRDARRHILGSLEPLLQEMVAKVLPAVARQSLGHLILEELRPLASELAATPVEVRTAPACRDQVEALLSGPDAGDLPVTVVAEPTLSEGQAYLRLAGRETKFDLDGAVQAITTAVAAFFDAEQRDDT